MADMLDGSRLLDQFSDKIRKSPERAEQALIEALNAGGDFARERGIQKIHAELNLQKDYIDKHLEVTRRAVQGDLRVIITGRRRPTTLYTYGGNEIATTKAKSPLRKLKGDDRRRIRRGQKAAGIKAFKVKRQGPDNKWPGGFLMFLNNGNVAMAVRTGKGRNDYEIRYGPSVGSAWSNVRSDVYAESLAVVAENFQKAFTRIF